MKKKSTLFGGNLLFFCLLFLSHFNASAQNQAFRITSTVSDGFFGDTIPYLEYKPPTYSAAGNTKKYPLIIFLHGGGERSDDVSIATGEPVWSLENFGPARLAKMNKMAFTWNNVTDTFIVLSPMCRNTYRSGSMQGQQVSLWPASYVTSILNYAKNNLRIDTNRVYLTGLSLGGGGTFSFLAINAGNAKRLAAAAPIAAPVNHFNGFGTTPNGPQYVGEANLPVWGFHAQDDVSPTQVTGTTVPINAINNRVPAPQVKALMTIWPTGVVTPNPHTNSWPRVYNTDVYPYGTEGIVNIYEWFLGQNKSLAVNALPTANAGSDFGVTSSPGTATLNGSASSDAGGGIVRYVWRPIAAPSGVSLSSIAIANVLSTSPTTTASNLTTVGAYTFRLYVVDTRAAIDSNDVVVTVSNTLGATKAMTFTTNGRIQSTNVTELNNTSKFTLEARFQYDATLTGWTTIMRKMTSLTDRIMLHIRPSTNSIAVMVGNGADSRGYTPDNSIAPGNWYHVAAVFDGTLTAADRLKIYLNGVLQTLTFPNGYVPTNTSSTNTAVFMAGGEPSCCNLNGTLDEVRVWGAALSSTTINAWKDKQLGTCHPDFANLAVYWPLDDNSTSGTVAAALGTTYTGSITNGTYVNSTQATTDSGCSSTPPKAVSFSSSTGRIQTGDVTELNGASKFTLEAQFKYNATVSTYTTIFRKSASGTSNRIMMHIGPSNNSIHLVVANGYNSYGVTGANVVAPGTWYHAAVVYDGTLTGNANRLKLYINGVLQTLSFSATPADIPATTGSNTAPFMAGGEGGCCYLNGTIDEVRVWNTALTSATINEWKDKLLGSCHTNASNLVLYWPLNDDATATSAPAGLSTSYVGTITSGSYVTSTQATASSGCGGPGSPAVLADYNDEVIRPTTGGILYPNPTRDIVQIKLTAPSATPVVVKVFDMYGRYVFRNQRSVLRGENNLSVNIASLPRGTYIIEVHDGKLTLGKYKVIKR